RSTLARNLASSAREAKEKTLVDRENECGGLESLDHAYCCQVSLHVSDQKTGNVERRKCN
ncbi:MAG: hypothetical protein ACK4E4_01250, partial [Rhodocyclaceae bacterium]